MALPAVAAPAKKAPRKASPRAAPPAPAVKALQLPEPPASLAKILAAAKVADGIAIEARRELDVEAVRRRLTALLTLTDVARPAGIGKELTPRLFANAMVGESHLRFGEAIFEAGAPLLATGEALDAFRDQVERTATTAFRTASAQLRSCADLAAAARVEPEVGAFCAGRLARIPAQAGGEKTPLLKGEVEQTAAVTHLRQHELTPCFDALLAARPSANGQTITARLVLDSLGRVEEVTLDGPAEAPAPFSDCTQNVLKLWVFPGLSDVEIELPMKVSGGAARVKEP